MIDLVELPQHEPVVQPGDVVDGRYEILSTVAQGGMGTVFLAEHLLIKRRLAIKILHPSLASDTEMVQRFLNEAMAAGTLGHSNIVEATDMGFTLGDGRERVPFIVFEYLEGALLSEEVYRVGGMPVRRALAIAKQIASALDTAHHAGIVHLDLKSDNVLLTDREGVLDHVKVLDFGISRFMGLPSRTTRGLVMGTPEFMAPEQIAMPDDVDGRADIYALGVLLYEMLTARLPYHNADPRILLYRICNETPPALDRDVPPELERIIFDKLLAKNRADRFQTMKDVEVALGELIEQLRTSELDAQIAAVALPTVPEPARAKAPRRWPALLALALFAAAGGGAAKYGEYRMQESELDAALATVKDDAAHVASAMDAQVAESQLRADTVASAPLLVAALANTTASNTALQALAKKNTLVPPRPDEVIEVFQLRKGRLVSVLRLPAKGRPIALRTTTPPRESRLAADINRVQVIATTPVANKAGLLGVVAVAHHLDLEMAREQLERDTVSATLVGLGREVDLVRPPVAIEGKPLEAVLAIDPQIQSAPLTLSAVIRPRPRGRTLRTGSHLAFGAASLFAIEFLAFKKRR